jgi:conjugative transposon TraM protein
MEENKKEVIPPKEPDKPRKEMTEEQRQRQKKMIVYPLMVLLFIESMWLIFAPSEKEEAEQRQGFNTDIPQAADNKLMGDKQKAYEQAQMEKTQAERKRQMQDLASMFGNGEEESTEMPTFDEPQAEPKRNYGDGGGSVRPKETIHASASAYRDINRTLGNFYETPKEDPEKEELKQKLEQMQEQMAQMQSTPQSTMDEQIALMEKSYELAAKYNQGQQQGMQPNLQPSVSTPVQKNTELIKNGKAQINNVGEVRERVVSGLSQPIDNSTFIAEYSKPRNMGFHTAVGNTGQTERNTIKACVHDNQTITDGQAVRLRLLEAMRAGTTVIPQNTLVTGIGKIGGERLGITITALEYKGLIIPVELTVVDTDGQDGIFIPGSMEMSAIKEVAANLGGNLGTTINLNQQSAGDQLLTDLGKGAIQGASQYISKKMRTVKVHLKAGYKLMLYQNKQ